jgi:hypothetical protein
LFFENILSLANNTTFYSLLQVFFQNMDNRHVGGSPGTNLQARATQPDYPLVYRTVREFLCGEVRRQGGDAVEFFNRRQVVLRAGERGRPENSTNTLAVQSAFSTKTRSQSSAASPDNLSHTASDRRKRNLSAAIDF